jgi:sugar lactone lactonase YvrE
MTLQRTATLAAEGFTLLEAPRWHDGLLWTSDFYTHRVLRWDVAGTGTLEPETVCIVEGRPSGLGFMPDGELRISSMLDRRLLSWDGTRHEVVADYADLVTGPGNDLVIDSAGIAFVGNFGLNPADPDEALPTSLLRITPDGTVSVAAEDVLFPNGMVIDEGAGVLYAAETFRARITAWDYAGGELSNRRVWTAFGDDPGSYMIPAATAAVAAMPDGLAQDAEGMLWVADAKGHGASRIAPDGSVTEFVETGLSTYAVALGGERGDELFLCCAPPAESWNRLGSPRSVLMRCRVDVPAAP